MSKEKKKKPAPKYGLSKAHTRQSAREFLDMDYVDSLNEKEKQWLDKFCREYYQATFTNTPRDKHKTKVKKRKCYADNNARNRDMWNQFDRIESDADRLSKDTDPEESK